MSRYLQIFFVVLLIAVLAAFELAFVRGLPSFASRIDLTVVVLVLLLSVKGYPTAIGWAFGAGALFDLYSFEPFGMYFLGFAAAVTVANLLLKFFFTNRSLYSFLALTFFASVTLEVGIRLIAAVAHFFANEPAGLLSSAAYFRGEAYGIGLNLAAALIIFYFSNFASKKLKPVFLFKAKM